MECISCFAFSKQREIDWQQIGKILVRALHGVWRTLVYFNDSNARGSEEFHFSQFAVLISCMADCWFQAEEKA